MAKKNNSKQKKMSVRVDFTPMVDMMMLLITFFMLCTSLSKPQAMQLSMPSNDENMSKEDKSVTKASQTITLYLASDDKLYYVEGLPDYENPDCIKETTWGKDGVRSILIHHTIELGYNPVAMIMQAKKELDAKKQAINSTMTDEQYQKQLDAIRKGELPTGKIETMTIIIKPLDSCSYKNMVEALDEMQICSISKYVIDKINPQDLELLGKKGIK
ncbi:MAG: biopolymer transporter ExbD [Prevotella sp.]|nr:biopolymer transporter ExbD [Prevotella sp.]